MDKDAIGTGISHNLEKSLAKSLEGLSLDLIQGEVFMVYPALGVYLIIPKMGEVTADLTLACSLSGSIGRSGVRGSHIYDSGDQVLLGQYSFRDNPLNIDGKSVTAIGYILSSAPPDFMSSSQGYPGSNIHSRDLDLFQETMTDAFASTKKLEKTLRDISFGAPNDVFAGDMYEYGPLHTFLTVCASKAAVGASPMAMVEAFAFHDKVRITARSLEDRSMTVESGREIDEDAVNYYERRAISESEGLGAVGEGAPAPMQEAEDDGSIELAEADAGQLGVFRHTALAGKIADGEYEALVRPVEEGAIHTSEEPETVPVGMVRVRKTYDGRHETRAAGGIDHVKSLFIPVPEQTKPHDAEAFDAIPEAEEAYERRSAVDLGGAFSPFSAVEEANEVDEDEAKNRNSIVRARSDHWRSMTREQLAEQYPDLEVEDAPRKLDLMDSDASFYEEPPSVEIEDPVTLLQRKVYALESIIRQQPDGTVVISDGHGSEIRMFRGRISISPAADLELRPGRDCIELVPRRKVVNAGEEVQIVSNEGKVRVKAETDVDVLAGNSGNLGRILLETRTPELTDTEKTGIHIKTQATLFMTGHDVYMGLNPPGDVDEDLGGFARENAGTIAIDARLGKIGLFGQDLYGHMLGSATLSSRGSVLALQGGNATLIANTGLLGVGQLQMSTIKGVAAIPRSYFAAGGSESDFIEAPQNPGLKIAGDILATGSVLINGTLAASSVNAKNAAFENATDESGMYTSAAFNPTIEIEPFDASVVALASDSFQAAVPQNWGDAGLLGAHFQFDKPPEVSTQNFEMQLMRWQMMLQAGGNAVTWSQKAVRDIDGDDTFAYPGHGTESTTKGPINGGKLGKKTFNEYIVNVGL